MSHGCPAKCMGMISFVCGVICFLIVSAVIRYVVGSMSAKMGVIWLYSMEFGLAIKVFPAVIPWQFFGRFRAATAVCRAAVPLHTPTQYLAPV